MHVIVAANVLKQQKTGVETYTFELLRHLGESDIRLTVVASPSVSEQLSQTLPSSIEYASKFSSEMLSRSDVVHFPTVRFELRALLGRGVGKVATVHDLVPLVEPRHHSLRYRLYFRYALPVLLRRVHLLLTPSDATREDLVRVVGYPRERIAVTPLASRFPRAAGDNEREAIILSVGTVEPRKNTRGTVAAFIELKRRQPDLPHRLVCIGRAGWENDRSYLSTAGRTDIEWRGWVDDEELKSLYSRAQLLVYPSFYEGFGLPVLEAMSQGCPVITSDRSSLPEVAGDAAICINPSVVDEIVSSMQLLLNDRSEWKRRSQLGLERSEQFSWSRCARETVEAYQRIVREGMST